MVPDYRQVTFKVDPQEYESFEAFARRLKLSPYAILKLVVETWAGAEEMLRRIEAGSAAEPEAFAELGRLVQRVKTVAQLNGVFEDTMQRVAAHYGVKLAFPVNPGQGVKGEK